VHVVVSKELKWAKRRALSIERQCRDPPLPGPVERHGPSESAIPRPPAQLRDTVTGARGFASGSHGRARPLTDLVDDEHCCEARTSRSTTCSGLSIRLR